MSHTTRPMKPLAALVTLALGACASSPYIANTRPSASEPAAAAAASALPRAQAAAVPGTLSYSLAYADATYDAYQAKLGEEYSRQQQLSNGLLTLGALTVGAGIGKAHRDVLITAAMGGGLAYQLGSWNSNDSRLGIYVEGMKAMACAKTAVAPLRMSEPTRKRIDSAERDLIRALKDAADALASTTQWLNIAGASQVPNSETAQTARTEITDAGAQFNQASELLKLSGGLGQKVDGAGAMLEARIDTIRGLIDDALKGTVSKLSSLPQQIASITEYANLFAPGLALNTMFSDRIAAINATPKPPGKSTTESMKQKELAAPIAAPPPLEPRAELAAALGRLRGTRVVLGARMAALSGAIERPSSQVQADLAGCGVDSAKISRGIALDRNQIVLTAGQAGTSWVTVSGGTLPYVATPMDTPTKGITVAAPAGGSVVMVVADAGTVAGSSYQVRVEDSAKAVALLTIKVDGKSAGSTTSGERVCSGFDEKNSALTCLVQNFIGVPATGLMNSGTCEKFIAKVAASGQLDDAAKAAVFNGYGLPAAPSQADILGKLSKEDQKSCKVVPSTEAIRGSKAPKPASNPPKSARTAYEQSISIDEVLVLSRKLRVDPPTRDLDDAFRRALANYQQRNGLPDSKGELTEPMFKRLMNE